MEQFLLSLFNERMLWTFWFLGLLTVGLLFFSFRRRKLRPFAPLTFSAHIPKSKILTIPNFNIHYQQIGQGPDLVLIHGIGASTFAWRFVVEPLSHHFRVTVIDLPGFGLSDKKPELNYGLKAQTDRLSQILDELQIESTYIMSSSMGAAISLNFARVNPNRVKKILALGPATDKRLVIVPPKLLALLKSLAQKVLNKNLVKVAVSRVVWNQTLVTDEAVDSYFLPYKSDPNAIVCFINATHLFSEEPLPEIFRSVKTPTMILHGKNDKVVPVKFAKNLAATLPNVELTIKENTGHQPMEDDPKWVFEKSLEFFLNSSPFSMPLKS